MTESEARVHGVRLSKPSGLCELGSKLRLGSVTNPKNLTIKITRRNAAGRRVYFTLRAWL